MKEFDLEVVVRRAPPMYQGAYRKALTGKLTPRQALRVKCLECCCWQRVEAEECGIQACPSWAYNVWRIRRARRDARLDANPSEYLAPLDEVNDELDDPEGGGPDE